MNDMAQDLWPQGGSARRVDATRDRLLSAAGRLFNERGYAGTSMRAVTAEAGVSVSAANYHFGSKRALLHAVCEREIGELNEERLAALDALDDRFAPAAPPLEEVLRAFFRPALRPAESGSRGAPREVAARLCAAPPEVSRELRERLFGPLARRMQGALAAALPAADPGRLTLALEFAVGAMLHTVVGRVEAAHSPGAQALAEEDVLDQLTTYCAAGIRAQVADRPGTGA